MMNASKVESENIGCMEISLNKQVEAFWPQFVNVTYGTRKESFQKFCSELQN